MTRPHICFIHAQCLPWLSEAPGLKRTDIQVKILSRDEEAGALTSIVRYPPGWQRESTALAFHEELFVLRGSLRVNDVDYGYHDYAFLPAGFERRAMSSPEGADVLTMLGNAPSGAFDQSLLVERIESSSLEWKTGVEGSVTGKPLSSTIFTKKLRHIEATGEQSFLYCGLPHHPPPPIMKGRFTHPMVEEIFVIGGRFVFGDVGAMGPGGYCWWRENEWHGPLGSDTGYLLFIRVHEGVLKNEFSKEHAPFSYDPPYRPQLPDDLMAIAEPYEGSDNY